MKAHLHEVFQKIVAVEDSMYKMNYAASIVSLVAERLHDNDESSSLWAASDLIKGLLESNEQQLCELRRMVFDLKNKAPEPKKRGRPVKKVSKK
jgi:hypothetical protein